MTDDGNHRRDRSPRGDGFELVSQGGDGGGHLSPDVNWDTYFAPAAADATHEEEMGWRDILSALRRRKWWVVAAVVGGVALGAAVAARAPSIYQSQAKLWVDRSLSEQTGMSDYGVLNGEGWAEFFHSSRVLAPAAREMNTYLEPVSPERPDSTLFAGFALEDEPTTAGRYRLSVGGDGTYRLRREWSTLPGPHAIVSRSGLFREDSLVQTGTVGQTIGAPAGFSWTPEAAELETAAPVRFTVRTLPEAVRRLRTDLGVEFNSETGLMTLRYRAREPERAARTLNLLLDHFVSEAKQVESGKLATVVENLENRVQRSEERLRRARERLGEEVSGPVSLDLGSGSASETSDRPSRSDAYFRQRARVRQLDTEIEALREARSAIESGESVDVTRLRAVSSESWPAPLSGVLSELDSLRSRRRRLLQSFTERHPDVVDLQQKIDQVRTGALPSLIAEATRTLEGRRSTLREELRAGRSRLQEAASENMQGRRLWSAYASAETLHSTLSARLQEARFAQAARLPAFEVLDRAMPPSRPFESRDMQLFAIITLAGLAIGLGGAVLRDRVDQRIREPEALRRRLGVPLLGVVPNISTATTSRRSSNEAILSTFRNIRNRIESADGRTGGVVEVTSPGLGDGKSTVATNLAVSYANAGLDTVLLDADIYRGCAHRIFGGPRAPGMTDHLLGDAAPGEIRRPTDLPGLSIVPTGRPSSEAADVIPTARTDRLLAALSARADVVVMDTPPLSAGSEAALLGEKSHRTVLVFRAGHTTTRLAEVQLRMLFTYDIPLVGGVLNDVDKSEPYYGYYAADDYFEKLEPGATGSLVEAG